MSAILCSRWILVGVLLAHSMACASGASAQPGPLQPAAPVGPTADDALVPPGLGTLRQDDFTVSLRSGPLLIKVTPLNESVIRLAAPDTYERLHALAEVRRAEASGSIGSPELFLVSFFSYEPDVQFEPADVELTHQGRLIRAARVFPITPGWGTQRLRQQETQSAIYAFEAEIDFDQSIGIRYRAEENRDWDRIISRLQAERARVRGRGS
ncbi:MAG TPA: hypothetical protein VNZ57_01870 [Longimicrobiales bacterium]|nr:hypothetical protein [Longimicrobiales bacterium]